MKLRFEFENSETVVQFPLGFCPGAKDSNFIKMKNCNGRWGFVIKEWETLTAVRTFFGFFLTIILTHLLLVQKNLQIGKLTVLVYMLISDVSPVSEKFESSLKASRCRPL